MTLAMFEDAVPVLIIDDHAPMRGVTRRMLQRLGLSDTIEDDGRDALARLRKERYGLVLCDMLLGAVTGLELLRALRALPGGGEATFIMMTAVADRNLAKAAREAGADGFVVKPFDLERLGRTLTRSLARGRKRRQRALT